MSMGEILEVLVSKARVEAEDAQRVLLGALNGLAALMLLEAGPSQAPMAIQTYRQVHTQGSWRLLGMGLSGARGFQEQGGPSVGVDVLPC